MYGGGPRARLWREGKLELDLTAPADQPAFITDGAQAELRHFVECLETGQTPSPSIAQALPATLLAWQVCQELGR
jgi:predicted dehydrogenase